MSVLPKNNKRSIIWKVSSNELQNIINSSTSIKEILNSLGLQGVTGNNRNTLFKRINEDKLDMSVMEKNRNLKEDDRRKQYQWDRQISNLELFSENSSSGRNTVRNRVIKDNLIPYQCHECYNNGCHNGKPLSLHLDHINGINNDNQISNLRFLCPNCHSQTSTYAGKKRKLNKSGTPDLN